MSPSQLKTSFEVESKHEAYYTGGMVQFSGDGKQMICQCGHQVQVLDVETGKQEAPIGQEEDDEVTCFCLSPDDTMLVVASRNLQLKQWDWKTQTVMRTWRAVHTAPITSMGYDCTSTLLATGGADSTIKVWDIIKHYCTHNLRGHTGIITVVVFHPDIDKLHLVSAGEDYKLRIWDLRTSTCLATLDSHYSIITAVQFSRDHKTLFSAGRDNVVTLWDYNKFTKQKTIPVYESVEGLVLVPSDKKLPGLNINQSDPHFITAGAKGVLKVWNARTAHCVFTQTCDGMEEEEGPGTAEDDVTKQHAIVALSFTPTSDSINTVTADHNIILHNLEDLSVKKHFVGNNDDVLDVKFAGPDDSHVVVATNSPLLKVFTVATWTCQVLHGHTDIIISLDVHKDGTVIVSGSKDNSVRVWQMDRESHVIHCIAVGHGHTHAVNAVTLPKISTSFLVSGSQDCTLKVWPMPDESSSQEVATLHSRITEKAHDKDINCITVAPNDKLIATGSMDKTAKLWNASNLSLVGVFRGHKRGIWCVQFSTVDQCLATASADCTIKMWALTDFSCVRTFEGHQSSVLKVVFLARGMQLLSSGSDGLLKLWTIKTSECVHTADAHDEKVWALSLSKNEQLAATGAGDSNIIIWKDVTEVHLLEEREKQEDFILKEQELMNLLHEKKYLKAIGLAITLEQPFRLLGILKEILNFGAGEKALDETLGKLRMDQLDAVLRYSGEWNTNSKHCHIAQQILAIILRTHTPEDLAQFPNVKSSIEALLSYTDRHFDRMNRLLQQSMFVDYTWQCMKPVSNRPSTSSHDKLLKTVGYVEDRERGKNSSSSEESSDESEEENMEAAVPKVSPHAKLHKKSLAESDTSDESEEEMETEIITAEHLSTVKSQPQTIPKEPIVNQPESTQSDTSEDDEIDEPVVKESPKQKNISKSSKDKTPAKSSSEKLVKGIPVSVIKDSSSDSIEGELTVKQLTFDKPVSQKTLLPGDKLSWNTESSQSDTSEKESDVDRKPIAKTPVSRTPAKSSLNKSKSSSPVKKTPKKKKVPTATLR